MFFRKTLLAAVLGVSFTALTACQSAPTVQTQPQSQSICNAKALINTFTTGDSQAARALLGAKYTQHNLAFGNGVNAFAAAVDALGKAPVKTTVTTVRAFEDGDKVVLHNIYNFAGSGEQVAFDVFRFDSNGKIV